MMKSSNSWIWGIIILVVLAGMIWTASHVWLAGNNATVSLVMDSSRVADGVDPGDQESPRSSYARVAVFSTGLRQAQALAVSPHNEIVIAGSRVAAWLNDQGRYLHCHALPGDVRCLTFGPDGSLWVGTRTGTVARLSSKGAVEAAWAIPGSKAFITGIAVDSSGLFAADAGQRKVWRLDFAQGVWSQFPFEGGKKEEGFIIPSPYFDLFLTPENRVHVVNPGRHRIEIYTRDGNLNSQWGKASWGREGFCGCCNPSYIMPAAGGRTVTSEKGIRRIKLYSDVGRFEEMIADPDILGAAKDPCPIAVDRNGRIIVLDPLTATLYVFAQSATRPGSGENP